MLSLGLYIILRLVGIQALEYQCIRQGPGGTTPLCKELADDACDQQIHPDLLTALVALGALGLGMSPKAGWLAGKPQEGGTNGKPPES